MKHIFSIGTHKLRTPSLHQEKAFQFGTFLIRLYSLHSYLGLQTLEETVEKIEHSLLTPNSDEFGRLVRACGDHGAYLLGKSLHAAITRAGMGQDMFLLNTLVNMYGRCSSVMDARQTFNCMRERNVFSWTVMVTAYARNGYSLEAAELFERMQLEGIRPNDVTLVAVLGALDSPSLIHKGTLVHSFVKETGTEVDVIVRNAVVCMYGRCGSLQEAQRLFFQEPEVSVASWNGLLSIHVQQGEADEALTLYSRMKLVGVQPMKVTFVTVLSACDKPKLLSKARCIHAHAAELGLDQDVAVGNALLSMYSKCRSLTDALAKFEEMEERNVISWSAMIGAYASLEQERGREQELEHQQDPGHVKTGLKLFSRMQQEGVKPNEITFASLLSLCNTLEAARALHSCIRESGLELSTVVIGSGLVSMYSRCGSLEQASQVFDNMQRKNTISWTSMIAAYGLHGEARQGFHVFQRMQLEGCKPDNVTFITLLDICSSNRPSLARGRLVHNYLLEAGLRTEGALGSALVNMYGKCGSTERARTIFDSLPGGQRSVSTWNSLITSYAQGGHASQALGTYLEMLQLGIQPDAVTFTSVLAACSSVGSVEKSHGYLLTMVGDHELVPSATHYGCVVDVLCRAGRLELAEAVMEEILPGVELSKVLWLTVLSACKIHKNSETARRAAERIVALDPSVGSVYALLAGICSEDDKLNIN